MPFPFRYVLTDSELQVRLAGWACAKVSYNNIQSIQVTSWFVGQTEKYPCFSPPTDAGVLIRKKSGWIPNFYITPEDPESFARELAERSYVTDVSTTDPYADNAKVRFIRTLGKVLVRAALLIAVGGAATAVVAMFRHRYS